MLLSPSGCCFSWLRSSAAKVLPNVICYNSTCTSCEQTGRWWITVGLLRQMSLERVTASSLSYNSAIAACEQVKWELTLGRQSVGKPGQFGWKSQLMVEKQCHKPWFIPPIKMLIWGMVYCCFNHMIPIDVRKCPFRVSPQRGILTKASLLMGWACYQYLSIAYGWDCKLCPRITWAHLPVQRCSTGPPKSSRIIEYTLKVSRAIDAPITGYQKGKSLSRYSSKKNGFSP